MADQIMSIHETLTANEDDFNLLRHSRFTVFYFLCLLSSLSYLIRSFFFHFPYTYQLTHNAKINVSKLVLPCIRVQLHVRMSGNMKLILHAVT